MSTVHFPARRLEFSRRSAERICSAQLQPHSPRLTCDVYSLILPRGKMVVSAGGRCIPCLDRFPRRSAATAVTKLFGAVDSLLRLALGSTLWSAFARVSALCVRHCQR